MIRKYITSKYILHLFTLIIIITTAGGSIAGDDDIMILEDTSLKKDTEWYGSVYVKGVIHVPTGITLTIRAGTNIGFEHPGLCDDGNVNFSIDVEGSIIAKGTKEEPILFTNSGLGGGPSSFGEIYIHDADKAVFEHCRFVHSHWGLHVHDSVVTVKHCEFKDCFGGIRFKGDGLLIQDNVFINNDTSLRFWMASPLITNNRFSNVATAIFMREKVEAPMIKSNDFSKVNDYFIKMGEMQSSDVTIHGNFFGEVTDDEIAEKIFDKDDEDYVGKVIIKK